MTYKPPLLSFIQYSSKSYKQKDSQTIKQCYGHRRTSSESLRIWWRSTGYKWKVTNQCRDQRSDTRPCLWNCHPCCRPKNQARTKPETGPLLGRIWPRCVPESAGATWGLVTLRKRCRLAGVGQSCGSEAFAHKRINPTVMEQGDLTGQDRLIHSLTAQDSLT